MARLVLKFGGTSVANLDRIRASALHVKREVDAGHEVAVVVSAMAGKTNELVAWVGDASPLHDAREYDAVVASGEQVTAGLMAIVLQQMGITARSWQGWQIPILTSGQHGSARVAAIDGGELIRRFGERKEVAVIAGFQGLHRESGRITTLGRGGSDTSAVVIAAAIKANRCDIYTDVDGVYTTDPRVVTKARRLDRVAFEEMLEMASLGAKVLQVRSVEAAMVHGVTVCVRSSFDDPAAPAPGTLICAEEDIMEHQVVTGIAFSRDEAQITLRSVTDKPGIAAAIFGPLAEAAINVDMIIQVVSDDTTTTDMTFTVPMADFARAKAILETAKGQIGFGTIHGTDDVVKVSAIGIGMRSHAGVAARAFKALAEKGINIRAITTSEIKFSVLIDAAYTELAVRTLHTLYGLDRT
jgi:aspartate kinase